MVTVDSPPSQIHTQTGNQADFSCATSKTSLQKGRLEGREVIQLATEPDSIFHKILAFLKKIPLLGSLISVIEDIYNYIREKCFSTVQVVGADATKASSTPIKAYKDEMLYSEEIENGIRKWAPNMLPGADSETPDHVTMPIHLEGIRYILDDESRLSVSPLCIPLHVGNHNSGHWTTLVLHNTPENKKTATLFNSMPSCGTKQIIKTLKPLLHKRGIKTLKPIAYNLQQHLTLGCGVFTVAAIDAVMTNHTNNSPKTVNQVLQDFAKECRQRSPAQQDTWNQEWRARMNIAPQDNSLTVSS